MLAGGLVAGVEAEAEVVVVQVAAQVVQVALVAVQVVLAVLVVGQIHPR